MTEKIRVIKALANPIGRRVRRAKKRRTQSKARGSKTRGPKYVIRVVVRHKGFYRAEWWTGSALSRQRSKARRYSCSAARALAKTKPFRSKLPRDYVVADILPV